jgi:hypothetical protein
MELAVVVLLGVVVEVKVDNKVEEQVVKILVVVEVLQLLKELEAVEHVMLLAVTVNLEK